MLYRILNSVIQLSIYVLFAASALYLMRGMLVQSYRMSRKQWIGSVQRRQLRMMSVAQQVMVQRPIRGGFRFRTHIENLIVVAFPVRIRERDLFRLFLQVSLSFGGAGYVFFYFLTQNILTPFLPALVALMMPYFVARLLVWRAQITNSYDIVEVASLLANQYGMQDNNMLLAIDKTLDQLNKNTPLRRSLQWLYLRLQRNTSDFEARDHILAFNRQTATTWSAILSDAIYAAIVEHLDVTITLRDLTKDLSDVESIMKDQHSDRADNMGVAILIDLTLPVGWWYLYTRISPLAIYDQFHTSHGVKLLTYALGMMVFSTLLTFTMYKPKQDL